MSWRLATFNVESMFERPKALNLPTWADGREILNEFARLTNITQKAKYTAADKRSVLETIGKYPGLLTQSKSQFIGLREYHGKLTAWLGARDVYGRSARPTPDESGIIGTLPPAPQEPPEAKEEAESRHSKPGARHLAGSRFATLYFFEVLGREAAVPPLGGEGVFPPASPFGVYPF